MRMAPSMPGRRSMLEVGLELVLMYYVGKIEFDDGLRARNGK